MRPDPIGIHEASHVVLAQALGVPIGKVAMNPYDPSGSFTMIGGAIDKSALPILAAGVAGEAIQERFDGFHHGGNDPYDNVSDYSIVGSILDTSDPPLTELASMTRPFFACHAVPRKAIEHLGRHLEKQGELSGAEASHIAQWHLRRDKNLTARARQIQRKIADYAEDRYGRFFVGRADSKSLSLRCPVCRRGLFLPTGRATVFMRGSLRIDRALCDGCAATLAPAKAQEAKRSREMGWAYA